MSERAAFVICRYCGAGRKRYLGECQVCGEAVCPSCGNLQDSVRHGRVAIHNVCIMSDPEKASDAFEFIRFTR